MDLAPEDRFKSNLLALFDIVEEMFNEGVDNNVIEKSINILPLIKLFIKKTSGEHMVKRFINRTNEYWDIIKRKDDEYIKTRLLDIFNNVQEKGMDAVKEDEDLKEDQDNKLVNSLSKDHFVVFKDLLSGSYTYEGDTYTILDNDRKEDIWRIMHSFVKISLCYIHNGRKWVGDKYTVPFFDTIKVKELASEWGVKSI